MTSESAPSGTPAVSVENPEPTFFRAWALRSLRSSDSDPLSSTPISPKTVPKAVLARAKRATYQGQSSEASQPTESTREAEATIIAPWGKVYSVSSWSIPQLTLPEPSVGGLPIQLSSRRPSLGRRAQKLLGIRTQGFADSASPSNDANQDYEWKREITGHWFQVRIGRKRRSKGRLSIKSEEATPALPDAITTANTLLQADSSTRTHSTLALPTPAKKEGFYNRVMRKISLRQEAAKPADDDELDVKTLVGEMLIRASTILRPLAERKGERPSSSASDSMNGPGSYQSRSSHNRFAHLFPFYKPGHSSSSSIRDRRMVDVPQTTPNSDAYYLGSDGQQYLRVEISDPDGPSYLPSEARRVGTPPLRNTLRGFFFDYSNPEGDLSSPEALEGSSSTQARRPRKKSEYGGADWYKAKMEAIEASDARADFTAHVTDHLMYSPLCPRHPLHPSGGKGVCPWHGRNPPIGNEK